MPSTQVHGGDDGPERALEPAPVPIGAGLDSARVRSALAVAVLALLTVLAYSNTFHSPFVFDDTLQIVRNPMIRELSLFAAPGASARPASKPIMSSDSRPATSPT